MDGAVGKRKLNMLMGDEPLMGSEEDAEVFGLEYKYRFHVDKLRASFSDIKVDMIGSAKAFGVNIHFKESCQTICLERRMDATPPHSIKYTRHLGWKGWRPYIYKKRITPHNWTTKEVSMKQLIAIIERIKADRELRGLS